MKLNEPNGDMASRLDVFEHMNKSIDQNETIEEVAVENDAEDLDDTFTWSPF